MGDQVVLQLMCLWDFQTTNEVLFINETALINTYIFSVHGWESAFDEG